MLMGEHGYKNARSTLVGGEAHINDREKRLSRRVFGDEAGCKLLDERLGALPLPHRFTISLALYNRNDLELITRRHRNVALYEAPKLASCFHRSHRCAVLLQFCNATAANVISAAHETRLQISLDNSLQHFAADDLLAFFRLKDFHHLF